MKEERGRRERARVKEKERERVKSKDTDTEVKVKPAKVTNIKKNESELTVTKEEKILSNPVLSDAGLQLHTTLKE
ncbi:hypothetical protein E1301_Tti019478 [Triplophysa tibetana]|uniref:Uncharacterized protein n=1 Tax=Triplophysa tibetana TaxID=1572043 RepID=A0A5A9NQH2_9TELE|nr:hypothetical protein E1301_Tti019478 [Triplophysa tibetana]